MSFKAYSTQDKLILDFSNTTTALTGVITGSTITGFGVSGEIDYEGFGYLEIRLSEQADQVTITSTTANTTIVGGSGGDTYTIHAPDYRKLSSFLGSLTIIESSTGTGSDVILLSTSDETSGTTGSLTKTSITGLGQMYFIAQTNVEEITIDLGSGNDFFTVAYIGSNQLVHVLPNDGNDVLNVGGGLLSQLSTEIPFTGGAGNDLIIVDNSASHSNAFANFSVSTIHCTDLAHDIVYDEFEQVEFILGLGNDNINIADTPVGIPVTVNGGGGADYIYLSNPIHSDLTVDGGDGPDNIILNTTVCAATYTLLGGAGDDTITVHAVNCPITINGGQDDDTIIVAPDRSQPTNLITVPVYIDGGNNSDTTYFYLYGKGTANYYISDPLPIGVDNLFINGTDMSDEFLFRPTFIALVHSHSDLEFVHIGEGMSGKATVSGGLGKDLFVMDDNNMITEIYGGEGDDSVKIGQLFHGPRDSTANLSVAEYYQTVRTTSRYLSDGCTYPVAAYGGPGDDSFVVLRNLGEVDLFGDEGDDDFVVKAFVLYGETDIDPRLKNTTVSGGEGSNNIHYTDNALLSVNGGPGNDTLTIIGTELDDVYVVNDFGVYGAGRYVSFSELEKLSISGDSGDDTFYVYSTAKGVLTHISGGLGSDTLIVGSPHQDLVTVHANDLRGYSSVVKITVDQQKTFDPSYLNLQIEGMTINVGDAQTPMVMIDQPVSIISDSFTSDNQQYLFENPDIVTTKPHEYFMRLTMPPTATVYITMSQTNKYKTNLVNISPPQLVFTPGNYMMWQKVSLSVSDYAKNNLSPDLFQQVFILHSVSSTDTKYNGLAVRSVEYTVIDSNRANVAMTLLSEPTTWQAVEGDTSDYPLALPMNLKGLGALVLVINVESEYDTTQLSVTQDVPFFDYSGTIFGSQERYHNIINVHVQVLDDAIAQGDRITFIKHRITGCGAYDPICSHIINTTIEQRVWIRDNEQPGVYFTKHNGELSYVETGLTGNDAWNLFGTSDTLHMRLTKQPTNAVVINFEVLPTPTEFGAPAIRTMMPLGTPSYSITFTGSNWRGLQGFSFKSYDAAPDINQPQGYNVKVFPAQPANLFNMLGPLHFDGGNSVSAQLTYLDPVMLPWEFDQTNITGGQSSQIWDIEDEQVDVIKISNGDSFANDEVWFTASKYQSKTLASFTNIMLGNTSGYNEITYQNVEVYYIEGGQVSDTLHLNVDAPNKIVHVATGPGNDHVIVENATSYTSVDTGAGSDLVNINEPRLIGTLLFLMDNQTLSGADNLTISAPDSYGPTTTTISPNYVSGLGMQKYPQANATLATYAITPGVYGAESKFILALRSGNCTISMADSNVAIAQAIQKCIIPNPNSCGLKGTSRCPQSVDVTKLEQNLVIVFNGAWAFRDPEILEIHNTTSFYQPPPYLQGKRQDLLKIEEHRIYYFGSIFGNGFEYLNINLGASADVVNVLGTIVDTALALNVGGGDNSVYFSSNANYSTSVARSNQYLDDGQATNRGFTVNAGTGNNIMQISDANFSRDPRDLVVFEPGQISLLLAITGSLQKFISYTGFWQTLTYSFGDSADRVQIKDFGVTDSRCQTLALFMGGGNDSVTIQANHSSNARFVVFLEEGNDQLDASAGTQQLLAVGGAGDDYILGGQASDFLFGDEASVTLGSSIMDQHHLFMDTVCHPFTYYASTTVASSQDGSDQINGNAGADFIFGGGQGDALFGGAGFDIIFGDAGNVTLFNASLSYFQISSPQTVGGNDAISGGNDADLIIGGGGNDQITGDAGNDVLFGDYATGIIKSTPTDTDIISVQSFPQFSSNDGQDTITDTQDKNVIVGGGESDTLRAGGNRDIVIGDGATFTFYNRYPSTIESTSYSPAGDDSITVNPFNNALVIGGDGRDNITTANGMDMIFGDQAYLTFNHSYVLQITSAKCTPSAVGYSNDDSIFSGDGEDIIFGGPGSDTINGGTGNDIIYGDQGSFDSTLPLAKRTFAIRTAVSIGGDTINGGDGDDVIFGQEGNDMIQGGSGNNEIVGGSDVAFSADGSDSISTTTGADYILGDNGYITRIPVGLLDPSCAPWCRPASYRQHDYVPGAPGPTTFPIRLVTRLDDVDQIGAGDVIVSGDGDDVIYGQRGPDNIQAGAGDDEVIGGEGQDSIDGGDGQDILLGDSGSIVRSLLTTNGTLDQYTYYKGDGPRGMHKDIILEESVQITQVIPISVAQSSSANSLAKSILGSDYVLLAGGYTTEGQKYTVSNVWSTYALLASNTLSTTSGQDIIHGGAGNDIIIGQRGADSIFGDAGDDILIGDSANFAESFDQTADYSKAWPKVYHAFRCVNSTALNITANNGTLVHIPFFILPQELDSQRASDHVLPTIDSASENTILTAAGAASLLIPGFSGVIRPLAAFIPALTSAQVLVNNDFFNDTAGADLIVGDLATGCASVLTNFTYINESISQATTAIANFKRRASLLGVDSAKLTGAPVSINCGNDDIYNYGTANGDTIVGDNLHYVGALGDHVLASFSLSSHSEAITRIYNYFRDLENLAVDFDFLLYQAHADVVADIHDSTPYSYTVSIGNDNIYDLATGGQEVIVGDSATIVVKYTDPNAPAFITDPAKNAQAVASLNTQKPIRDQNLASHVTQSFKSSSLTTPPTIPATVTLPAVAVTIGNDHITASSGNDSLIGDNALYVISEPREGSTVTDAVHASALQAMVQFPLAHFAPANSASYPTYGGVSCTWAPYFNAQRNTSVPVSTHMFADSIVSANPAADVTVPDSLTMFLKMDLDVGPSASISPYRHASALIQFPGGPAVECAVQEMCWTSDSLAGNAVATNQTGWISTLALYRTPIFGPIIGTVSYAEPGLSIVSFNDGN